MHTHTDFIAVGPKSVWTIGKITVKNPFLVLCIRIVYVFHCNKGHTWYILCLLYGSFSNSTNLDAVIWCMKFMTSLVNHLINYYYMKAVLKSMILGFIHFKLSFPLYFFINNKKKKVFSIRTPSFSSENETERCSKGGVSVTRVNKISLNPLTNYIWCRCAFTVEFTVNGLFSFLSYYFIKILMEKKGLKKINE